MDKGIRNSHQILGVGDDGFLKNLHMTNNGELKVVISESASGDSKVETTLKAEIINVGISTQTIDINKKVTSISIANYSETSNINIEIDGIIYVIGANIATELPINKEISVINISATAANTKLQYIIKGVE